MADIEKIKSKLNVIPNFPKPDIDFVDILGIFLDQDVVDIMVNLFSDCIIKKIEPFKVDVIVGLEARGFLIAPLIANKLRCKFVPARKKGKLPGECLRHNYALEYGMDSIEIQKNAIKSTDKVVVLDDLLATGGTMTAAVNLVTQTGASVVLAITLVELDYLKGREKLNIPYHSFINYDSPK